MALDHLQAQKYGKLELLARQSVEGFITGLHRSPYHGFSVEFAEHRAYNTGESTRHIDWKLYGRTDKMFVKRFEEETNLRCQIIIDTSGSMHFPDNEELNKLRFCVEATAALTYLMRSQRDAVGITLFDQQINLHLPPRGSSAHHSSIFYELEQALEQKPVNGQSNIVDTLHLVAEQNASRSMVIVFSDFLDSAFNTEKNQQKLFDALQHLRHNKHEVVLFHVYDQNLEVELNLENRPHTFVDLETGEKIKLMPNEVQEAYRENRQKQISEIELTCAKFGIDWNGCNINQGIYTILDEFLVKRSRMG
jgi:uncharacterized protein (DUF58 family)